MVLGNAGDPHTVELSSDADAFVIEFDTLGP